jgi:RNA polymerase sigma-70 factor (ECF subfamily)
MPMTSLGSQQVDVWIEQWQGGDERAAEALYDHFRNQTFRLAYGLLGQADDAEEAAQDALTYALVNIARYDPRRASFSTWLHTITVSRCRDRRRRKRLPRVPLSRWLGWGADDSGRDIPSERAGPEEQLLTAEMHGEVWEAVQSLSQPQREAILLRYWAGHTYREMADIIGCPLPTAQSRVRLAYKNLRLRLSGRDVTALAREEDVR